jgi:hypothetical protein
MVMDDKSEDEDAPLVIIQEEDTVAPSQSKSATKSSHIQPPEDELDLENASEDEKFDGEKYDYEEVWGEDDMYEQEI